MKTLFYVRVGTSLVILNEIKLMFVFVIPWDWVTNFLFTELLIAPLKAHYVALVKKFQLEENIFHLLFFFMAK